METGRTIDQELAASIQAVAARSGMQVEIGDLVGQEIRFAVAPVSDVVPTYRVRGEIANTQGLILHGFEGFMVALERKSGRVAIGSLKVDSIVHVILVDPSDGALLSWTAIEKPADEG
ncbi:hypothetical protein E1258_05490 [Micromonospora sp. KC207]|uniref:hypothetical protein n=1 Tax=Micromonospora sp. KC207 TaxID=2530377 RepID=UPI00104AE32C|nr:hypothetical protein [Micromonospora sp. KC207]TDC65515.1 hypothetical protein E1258_05490 [Micromonospora sp. KC207]